MAENAYLSRLKQLSDKKVTDNERKVQPLLSRPLSRNAPGPGMGPGPNQPQAQEEQGPDMNSLFGKNIESFQNQDKRFQSFMKEYGDLANGLRQEVDQGFMPMPIAQQRLKSYLQDSAGFFQRNKAGPMDNPEIAAKIEGMLGQAMQGQLPEQQAAAQEQVPAQAMTPQGGM